MTKYLLTALSALALMGCGGGGSTYVTNGEALPDVPENAPAFVIQGEGGSTGVIQYTTHEDGSITITCGDGAGYNCEVYLAEPVDEESEDNETEEE
jgi:hypothetical protein